MALTIGSNDRQCLLEFVLWQFSEHRKLIGQSFPGNRTAEKPGTDLRNPEVLRFLIGKMDLVKQRGCSIRCQRNL